MPSSASRIVVAALGIVFFAAPIGLRVLGVTAHPFENRALAGPPKLSQGFDAFNQTARFFVDRMPLREQAVRANTWLSRHIFDTTPRYGQGAFAAAGQVGLPFGQPVQPARTGAARPGAARAPGGDQALVGRDGWLYLQGDLDRACHPPFGYVPAVARWEALVSVVRRSGRRAIVVVAPDKSAVYPEHLPASFPEKRCAASTRRDLWARIEAASARGVVGLLAPLLAEKRRSHDPLYLPDDSHWNALGALVLVRAALSRVGGGVQVRRSEVVNPGARRYTGDLTGLLGTTETRESPHRTIRRAPRAPRVPGRTLLVMDSYGNQPLALLAPYFAHLDVVDWVGTPVPVLVSRIRAANTVIFETVEREFAYRASDQAYVTPVFVGILRATLGRHG